MRSKSFSFAFSTTSAALIALTLTAPARATIAIDNDDFKKITAGAPAHEAAKEEPLPQLENGTHGPASVAEAPVVKSEPAPGTRGTASETTTSKDDEKKPAAKAVAKPADKTAAKKAKPAAKAEKAEKAEKSDEKPTAKAEPGAPVDSETSLRWLTNGNTRFVKKQFRADGRTAQDRERLLAGEHPHAIIVASSDSRVPPELIFDQALGEIYVVRTAGEALDSAVIASIEDALSQFSPRLIVVLGHTNSHMIELAMKDGDAPTESIGKALADIRPRLKSIPAGKTSPNLEIEATVNADGVGRDLVKRSELIKKKVESGELVIKPALYRMDSGKVTFY